MRLHRHISAFAISATALLLLAGCNNMSNSECVSYRTVQDSEPYTYYDSTGSHTGWRTGSHQECAEWAPRSKE